MKPRTLKAALDSGYVIKNILYKGNVNCRVDVTPRFWSQGMEAIISYWVNDSYVSRTYPNTYAKF